MGGKQNSRKLGTTGGYAQPVVTSTRGSGEARLGVKIRNRVVGPCITDRNRLRDFRARDDNRVTLDARVSPDKMVIITGNRKTFHWTTISRLQTIGVLEADAYFVAVDRVTIEQRPGWNDFLTIWPRERPRRQTTTYVQFVTRGNIILVADVDRHSHPGLRLAPCRSLWFAPRRPR